MVIVVDASGLVTNPKKCEMSREDAIAYAKEQLGDVMEVFDVQPTDATIVLRTEGEQRDPVQKVSMKLTYKTIGKVIVQDAHSRNVKKAIDRCIEPMTRQLRRAKTKVIDKRRQETASYKFEMQNVHDVDDDVLFAERDVRTGEVFDSETNLTD